MGRLVLACVSGEDKVARGNRLVAREAALEHCFGGGLSVIKVTKPPAAR